jgi:ABC-type branched-subunit amino acid transport system substrate-binding protein
MGRNTINIGYIDHFKGDLSIYAHSDSLGVNAAIDYVNQTNMLGKYKLGVVKFDGESQPRNLLSQFSKEYLNAIAWITPPYYDEMLEYKLKAASMNIPMIFPATTYQNLTVGYNNLYQLVPPNNELGFASLNIVNDINSKKVVVWYDLASEYSVQYSAGFIDYFQLYAKNSQITKVFTSSYNDSIQMEEVVRYIKENNIDTIFIPARPIIINKLLGLLDSENIKVNIIMGDIGVAYKTIFESNSGAHIYFTRGANAKIYFVSYIYVHKVLLDKSNPTVKFFNTYLAKNAKGGESLEFSIKYFDSVLIIAQGIKTLLQKYGNIKDFESVQQFYEKLNEEIKNIKNLQSVSGHISVLPDGSVNHSMVFLESTPSGVINLDTNSQNRE